MIKLFFFYLFISSTLIFSCEAKNKQSPVADLEAKEIAANSASDKGQKLAKIVFDPSIKPLVADLNDSQKASFHKLTSKEFCPCGKPVTLLGCIAPGKDCKKSQLMADFIKQLLKADWPENMLMEDFNHVFSGVTKSKSSFSIDKKFCHGPDTAELKIHEFSDFECPHCKMAVKYVHALKKAFPNKVQVCFMPFPLRGNQLAYMASIIAFSMPSQKQFWAFHDLVFENQEKLSKELILKLSYQVGHELSEKDLEKLGEIHSTDVTKIRTAGDQAGLQGTPSFFINGNRFEGSPSFITTRVNFLLAK